MSATGRTEAQGFTLIEMLVVLAILGLVAAVAYPAVERSARGRQFGLAATTVESELNAARAAAIRGAFLVQFKPTAPPENIAVRFKGAAPVFFPDGSASGGEVLVTGGGRSRRFIIDAGTGEIAVSR